MRVLMSCLFVLCAVSYLSAADLGSPAPIAVQSTDRVKLEEKTVPSLPPSRLDAARISVEPCDCPAGVCPLCATAVAATPAATTYRLVWRRGQGWVWMEQQATSAPCPGGICPIAGRSK